MKRTIGVISDTHGLLRDWALRKLTGVDHIIHAGDVGDPAVLTELAHIAPVTAVRGNADSGPWASSLPATESVLFEKQHLYVLHILDELDLDPLAAGVSAVIFGHSHQPKAEFRHGVLYFNPGSAGPRRFRLPVSLGYIHINQAGLKPQIVEMDWGG